MRLHPSPPIETRFKVGQRVCVVGGVGEFRTVSEVIRGSITRYRLQGGAYMVFESDLTEVPA